MFPQALRIVAILACMSATSAAQQPQATTQTLDEVNVAAPEERERRRAPATYLPNPNLVTVGLKETINVQLRVVKEQAQVAFRRKSVARRLPEGGAGSAGARSELELLPDRIIAHQKPWIRDVKYLLDANIDEVDGVPAHISFGPDVALVNLEYLGLRERDGETSTTLSNAMHPQTGKCERSISVGEFWTIGTSPYVLIGSSMKNCAGAVQAREGDLLFASNVPAGLRQVVQEIHDPIASRLANRLGSEPGNIFVAWWEDSPHAGYHFKPGWGSNGLLLLHGPGWQQEPDASQQSALRQSLMLELIQRRISETDWPGPFTQSAVKYLVLLTSSEEERATVRRLTRELPEWISGCAESLQVHAAAGAAQGVSSAECGLVLQFVYDAVARSKSSGRQSIFDTWRELLDAAYRRRLFGATPGEFLDSSPDARRIAQGLVDGSMDWSGFAADLAAVGVRLRATAGGSPAAFEVLSLEHFSD